MCDLLLVLCAGIGVSGLTARHHLPCRIAARGWWQGDALDLSLEAGPPRDQLSAEIGASVYVRWTLGATRNRYHFKVVVWVGFDVFCVNGVVKRNLFTENCGQNLFVNLLSNKTSFGS